MKNYFKSLIGIAVFTGAAFFNHGVLAHDSKMDDLCARYCSTSPPPDPVPQVKPNPEGNFVSSSQSKPGSISTDTSLITQPHVAGTLIKIEWSLLTNSAGVFDFTLIQQELDIAMEYSSYVTLAVGDGKTIPQYVLDSCETFTFNFRNSQVNTCLPWDVNYVAAKTDLINRLGLAFDSHPNLAGVYFTYAAMGNGTEMHFRVNESDFAAAGYTPDKLLGSYNNIMDVYTDSFNTTPIIMEIHNVFDSPALASGAYEHCFNTIGTRCGVAAWWCASRMILDEKSSEYEMGPILKKAANQSFAVCQTIGNFTDQPDRFGSGTSEEMAKAEMDFFRDSIGVKAFELWKKDIENSRLITYF